MTVRVIVEADGGARSNPGPAGYGAVVRDPQTGDALAERSEALGVATNNVAEYRGLIAGLSAAAELGASEVEVRMDSKLVVEQMSGRWQIKHPGLRPLAAQAASLARGFDRIRYTWIPRERNKHADALANRAMDEAAGKPVGTHEVEPALQELTLFPESAGGQRPSTVAAPKPSWSPRTDLATRLILVRHGATELTASGRYSGRGDVPLSADGLAQAQAVARRVAAMFPAYVVSSPLARCMSTAEAISGAAGGVPVVVEEDFIECDFGAWEGLTFAQVQESYPDQHAAWLSSTAVAPPDGESFQRVAKRVRGGLAKLLRTYEGQTVAVVSHVSPIKLMLRDALAAGDALLHRLYLDPAGVSVVDMWPDGGVAVRSVNETGFLR